MNDLSTYAFEFPPPKHAPWCDSPGTPLRLGIIADLHFAEKDPAYGRFYREALEKLDDAIVRFKRKKIDFLLELGDIKDQSEEPTRDQTLTFLDRAEARMQGLGKDVYHVLGNHDMDSISKADFLAHTHNPGEADGQGHYSFHRDGVTFIVLDATFRDDQSDYDRGNYDWSVAVVPDWELDWLERELQKGDEPVIVVVHQLLAGSDEIPRTLFIRNADAVNRLLIASKRVLAVFQGHHHEGDITLRNGILYFTFPGMIEGSYPENAYAVVEIAPDRTIRIELTGHRPPGV